MCNVSEADFTKGGNDWSRSVDEFAKNENNMSILICSAMEAEIAQLPKEEQKDFRKPGVTEPGLHRLIREAYNLPDYKPTSPPAKRSARVDHPQRHQSAASRGRYPQRLRKGFIRAETYNCNDLFELKSEQAVKDAGKYRSEGKRIHRKRRRRAVLPLQRLTV